MFRFLRTNLRSTRRRSASCPNLEHALVADEVQENNAHKNYAFKSSSESDSSEDNSPNKFERLNAQQSVRRGHLKEKVKKENTEKNLISMDDYLGKLSELKMWLKEERKKDVDNMRSPKLKAHFKTFVKLWNKRKLPLKYYRGCAVNLYLDEKSSVINSEMVKQLTNPQYPSLIEDSANYSTTVIQSPFYLNCDNVLNNISSPFSTFGKCDDIITSPTVLKEKANLASQFGKQAEKNTCQKSHKYNLDIPSPGWSPTKFATISRSIPAISRLHNFTVQPPLGIDVKSNPVPGLKCPDSQSHISTSSLSDSASATSIFTCNFKSGEHTYMSNIEQQSPSLTKSSGPSPVYSTTVDAIPYSTGSPKYAEIDENIQNPIQKVPFSGYCSLSPLQEWRVPYTNVKQTISKKQSLNRRRSKSLEDFYSVPFKADFSVKIKNTWDEEDTGLSDGAFSIPPIPDRKYSPSASSFTYPDQRNTKSEAVKEDSTCYISPSFQTSPLSSSGSGLQKRQSQGLESDQNNTNSLKNVKSTLLSNTDFKISLLENEVKSPKFSILTGSINPTTRSRYKSAKSSENSSEKCSKPRLSILEIKQLAESPKFPRRKLKRRSSSLSTKPGKGLVFGKTSKISSAPPKRVSFAKNVKETGNTAVVGKLFSLHHCTPQNFTKQTQERKEFETFLASHESPPKKSNSPNKVPSPDKNSSPNTSITTRRISPQKNLSDSLTPIISENLDNIPRKRLFDYTKKEDKIYDSQHNKSSLSDTIQKDRIFPPPQTRQVGRRVIGAPKTSLNKNIVGTVQINSQTKCLEDSSQTACSQKHFPNACQAASNKKSLSNATYLCSPQESNGTSSQLDSSQKCKESIIHLASQENKGAKNKLVSPDKNMRYMTNSATLYKMRVSSSSLSSSKYPTVVSPQKHSKLSPKSDSQSKDLTRQGNTSPKKLLDSSVVTSKIPIHSLVSKLAEKTTAICAKELSESDECLSSDEILNVVSVSNSFEAPAFFTNTSDSQNQERGKENEDFEAGVLESSPGSKTKETDVSLQKFSAVFHEVTSVKESDSHFHNTSETSSSCSAINCTKYHQPYMKDRSPSSDLTNAVQISEVYVPDSLLSNENYNKSDSQKTYSTSNVLLNQPVFGASLKSEMKNRIRHTSKEPFKRTQFLCSPVKDLSAEYQPQNSFQPKEIPSEVKVTFINSYTYDNNRIEYKKYDANIQPLDDILSNQTCGNVTPLTNSSGNNSLGLKSETTRVDDDEDNHETFNSASADKHECHFDLRRISSIRASPKIVDNDGWVTERRRSSKGKNLHSFRSAYNRYLLKSSKEENGLKIEQLAKEDIIPWTPDFVVVSNGENISLESKENILEMSQKSQESLGINRCIEKIGQTYVASAENKTVASPIKTKPPTLPKPAKASLLTNRKLTVPTKVVSGTSKATSKRRSSLARRDFTTAPLSRNSNENNKTNSRVSVGKANSRERLSGGKGKPRDRLSGGKDKPRERLSGSKDNPRKGLSDSKRVSSERCKSITKKYNEHGCVEFKDQEEFVGGNSDISLQKYSESMNVINKDVGKLVSSSHNQSKLQQPVQANRKSSIANSLVGRRRSKVNIATEEKKSLSFAEKRKFFSQQLNMNINKSNGQNLVISCQTNDILPKHNQQVKFATCEQK